MLVDDVNEPTAENIEDTVGFASPHHIPGPNLRRLLNAQDLQPLPRDNRPQS